MSVFDFQPADCKALIDKLKACGSKEDLLSELKQIKTWTFGKVGNFVVDYSREVVNSATLDKSCSFWMW